MIKKKRKGLHTMFTEDEVFQRIHDKIYRHNDGCWIWTGGVDNNGRPKMYMNFTEEGGRRQQSILPHKFLYTREFGESKARYYDNTCGTPRCVNPEHHTPRMPASRITKDSVVDEKSGCWNWAGGLTDSGYGRITKGGRTSLAHRISYEHFNGAIPKGLYVCHKCNNRRCVNPDHLYLGTHADNTRDMLAAGNQSRGEKNGQSILTQEHVVKIKDMIKSGVIPYRKIGLEFGVSRSAIKDIASGRTWGWVK